MKMPEKHDLLAAILAAKEQGIGAILAFAMAYLRGRYNGGAFTKTVIDATMCAIIAWFIRDLLDFAGLSSNLAYITSVFIGYIGIRVDEGHTIITALIRHDIGITASLSLRQSLSRHNQNCTADYLPCLHTAVPVFTQGELMFDDIDLLVMLHLVARVVADSLGNFLPTPLTSTTQSLQQG